MERFSVGKVLGEAMHITTQYLANEEKAVVANSKVEALETEASGLRNDLGAAMDALNALKETTKVLTEQLESEKKMVKQKDDLLVNASQRMKIAIAKAVTAFQTTEEYNTILFQWYFKGFEILRRYMIKHGSGVDLENLNFEAVDKEMEEDEAAQASAQTAASTGVEPSQVDKDDGGTPQVRNTQSFFFSFFFFWNAPSVFGAFLLNNQLYMICSFLCLISLSCFIFRCLHLIIL